MISDFWIKEEKGGSAHAHKFTAQTQTPSWILVSGSHALVGTCASGLICAESIKTYGNYGFKELGVSRGNARQSLSIGENKNIEFFWGNTCFWKVKVLFLGKSSNIAFFFVINNWFWSVCCNCIILNGSNHSIECFFFKFEWF